MMTDYQVQTDIYNGPMDLLLYLIRRNEIDLYDIPLALVTQQYCAYVELLSVIDPNVAGDFLVLAAVLMEMKSRMLLPRAPAEDGEAEDLSDPRLELVRQLLEYKKFKDVSFELGHAAQTQAMRWPRVPAKPAPQEPTEVDLEDVQIWDLVAAFNKIVASIGGTRAAHEVVFDDTPIALHAADVLDRLQAEGGELFFEDVFLGRTRAEMIGLFLALLELIRQQRVRVVQEAAFSPIRIVLLSAEPIEVGEEWSPTFREAVLGSQAAAADGTDDEEQTPTSDATATATAAADLGEQDGPAEDVSVDTLTGEPDGRQDADAPGNRPDRDAASRRSSGDAPRSKQDRDATGRRREVDAARDNWGEGEDGADADDDDEERFDELDRIKTDVDIEAVLRCGLEGGERPPEAEQCAEPPPGMGDSPTEAPVDHATDETTEDEPS